MHDADKLPDHDPASPTFVGCPIFYIGGWRAGIGIAMLLCMALIGRIA